ncbi:hypothetical protein AB1Y20_004636 [Prymnesium parvum]|uniref:SET domain-containing protein n=1 Tax=Prymnesium parvum TaxID=97485 RepID=A0AB34IX55_PRYPA
MGKRPRPPPPRAARLLEWLAEGGARLDGLELRETAGGGLGLFATRAYALGDAIGELPAPLVLDPSRALSWPAAKAALSQGASPPFAFWFALAAASRDASHPFYAYLQALPSAAPDPCAWGEASRRALEGTALAAQVESQRARVRAEWRGLRDRLGLSAEDVLWARGVHLSRCFPRELVAAARLGVAHEVVGSDMVDRALRVEQRDGAVFMWEGGADEEEGGEAEGGEAEGGEAEGGEGEAVGGEAVEGEAVGSKSEGGEAVGGEAVGSKSEGGEAVGGEEEEGGYGVDGCRLGCMLPLFDMFEHRCGHPIGWEAGAGGIRFRARVCVAPGEPLYNNYGPKGNGELLFTYGFAVPDNPLDTVEGIVIGCSPGDAGLAAERARLLDEHEVPYRTREDRALLIGPFELRRGEGGGDVRQVVGMDDVEEGPALSLDEIDLLKATLEARLAALLPSEAADARAKKHSREWYVGVYRDGQRRLLREALQELAAMAGGEVEG